ncbi:MAG TPA: helix-turn-helix transcriptional regulator [Ktedonobacteraceae bacterium]
MKRFSYREHDYAFGQAMLTLRTSIGLTQAGLAELLGISRHAVGDWEAGESYPKVDHLRALIKLGLRASAFAAGREEEEIHALWKAAHQKVLLDEAWLAAVLSELSPPPVPVPVEESGRAEVGSAPPAAPTDWASRQDSVRHRLSRWQAERLPRVDHRWIGGRRWMCPASMGVRGNWRPWASGWCRNAAGWSVYWAWGASASRPW